MEQETAERIAQLAKNLKEHHLAATMEEAYKRAKEIVLAAGETHEKSVKEMMTDAGIDFEEHEIEKNFKEDKKGHKTETEKNEALKPDIVEKGKAAAHILEGAQDILDIKAEVSKKKQK